MSVRVGMHEAKSKLSRLVEQARAGEDVVIERSGTPVAKLVPFDAPRSRPRTSRGAWRGKVRIARDFDELPDDLQRAFGVLDE